jgi:trk system potassium uptake protein TrkH
MGVGCLVIAVPVVASIESDIPFLHLLFDTVSALGTTGASTGIVPDLGITGKVVFMIAMFVGRLGPVTLALALAPQQDETELYRFAQERVRIG